MVHALTDDKIGGKAISPTVLAHAAPRSIAPAAGFLDSAAGTLESLLFHVESLPIAIVGASVGIMGSVALIATVVPAWRASRINPIMALRAE